MSSQKRKILALHERIAVLDKIKEGRSCCSIAEDLGVIKTQIQGIKGTKRALDSNGKPEVEERGSTARLESCATKIWTELFGSGSVLLFVVLVLVLVLVLVVCICTVQCTVEN